MNTTSLTAASPVSAKCHTNTSFDDDYMKNLINLSAPAWKDVQDANQWIHELRGE